MAMFNIDTDKLRKEANALRKTNSTLYGILEQLQNKVNEITDDVWDDNVAKEFTKRFKGLKDDFQNYDRVLEDYVNKALEIADEYDKANADANKQLEGLLSDL